jgi:putative ABC transport system ATP-binding protein
MVGYLPDINFRLRSDPRTKANHSQGDIVVSNNGYVLQAIDLRKDLNVGEVTVHALRRVSLDVSNGEFMGIIGPSGSGKSTLLGLIGGLDTPTEGQVLIDGIDITNLNERELTRIRNEKIGFVFQSFNLIPTLTALENVALPIQFSPSRKTNPTKRAKEVLEMLGLGDRLHHRPLQLSGGQQQRVAIARALANEPALLLADEPTGNLDTASSGVVMEALRNVQQQMGTTVILVTHDMDIASQVDRLITLVDGCISEDIDPRYSAQMAAVQALRDKRATGEFSALVLEDVSVSDMTSNEKMLEQARELLLLRQYDDARKILEIMTQNETAQRWLDQLEQIAPRQ